MTDRVHVFSDDALGNTSYLVQVGPGIAIAIDPRRDAGELLARAHTLGVAVVAVLETHLHADFVGGAREIAAETGAEIYAAADAEVAYAHTAVAPGTSLRIGETTIGVLATPGHTPEHIAFHADGPGLRALFSGGSLIVGGAARTDLTGANRTDELARAQFASLRRIATLPDDTALYPTHGAGSFCSTGATKRATSTIGDERASNRLFAIEDEQAFVEALTADFGSYPTYFSFLRGVNQSGAPLVRTLRAPQQVDAAGARAAMDAGAMLIDARPVGRWAEGHIAEAVANPLRPAFASWLGWIVPFGTPFVLLLEPEQLDEALALARRIGYDRAVAWTTFEAFRDVETPVESTALITPAEAAARGDLLLDVRQRSEVDVSRIPGAVHLELGEIIAGKTPQAARAVAFCGHGERSATAASLLAARGIDVAVMDGGFQAWQRAGMPVEA